MSIGDYKGYERARQLGTDAHAGKQWYAGKPYTAHLEAVEDNIHRFLGQNTPPAILGALLAAAWLHDAVEDTGMSLDLIEKECGYMVRTLVWAVTDEPGANRKERHEKTYPKTRNVAYAVALKLADRIANVEASAKTRGGYFDMYRKEHYDFKRALYSPGQYENMWAHLDALMAEDPSKRAIQLADKLIAKLQARLGLTEATLDVLHKQFASIIEAELKKD